MLNLRIVLFMMSFVLYTSVYSQSLFNDATYKPFVGDLRSYKMGQILTVLIYESATASSSTGTTTDKSMSVGIGASSNEGPGTPNGGFSGDLGINNSFGGNGSLSRTGKFVASVSVTIVGITESGDLLIRGKQSLEFNNEQQDIEIEGKVRPDDVSSDNSVISTRIADAKIKYLGEGLLSDREQPGILTKFFNWLF